MPWRNHRIQSVRSSLAIEGNSLDEEQVSAILDGKKVLAPPREIKEVKNALAAYDCLEKRKPISQKDLLNAHLCLMQGLKPDAGSYRSGGVGVVSGRTVLLRVLRQQTAQFSLNSCWK